MDIDITRIGEDFYLVPEIEQSSWLLVSSGIGSWYQTRNIGMNLTEELNGSTPKVIMQKKIREQFKLANIPVSAIVEKMQKTLKIEING